ncbi:mCG8518 [Mus musculus]|nr:mCG8518 [Mus musculus]
MNKGQTSEKKHIQNQNINHAGDFKNVLQCQLLKEHIPVDHIPASGNEESHSYLDQYDGGSSSYIFQSNRNKCQGRYAANDLPDVQDHFYHCIGHVSKSQPRVLYGIGKGGVVLRQGPTLAHYKSNVFVNPLAPEAPPLPSDWLIQLISSKRPSAHGVVSSRRSRGTSSLLVLERTTTLPPASSKSNPNIDLIMLPEVEFTATSESLEYYELQKQGQRALKIRQYTIESAYASIMQTPSSLPIMTKPRNELMEEIRKGIKLHKTQPRPENEDLENGAEMIRVRRKAMGYHSEKSDSETEWIE